MVTWADGLGSVSAAIAALAAIVAGVFSVRVYLATKGQLEAAKQQTRIAREELSFSQKQLEIAEITYKDQLLPILYPTNVIKIGTPGHYANYQVSICNSGPGTAYSIQAILEIATAGNQTYSNSAPLPVEAGIEKNFVVLRGGPFCPRHVDIIEGYRDNKTFKYTFFIGNTTTQEADKINFQAEARLILTYHDCYGRKHGSIWDKDKDDTWHETIIFQIVLEDIREICQKGS